MGEKRYYAATMVSVLLDSAHELVKKEARKLVNIYRRYGPQPAVRELSQALEQDRTPTLQNIAASEILRIRSLWILRFWCQPARCRYPTRDLSLHGFWKDKHPRIAADADLRDEDTEVLVEYYEHTSKAPSHCALKIFRPIVRALAVSHLPPFLAPCPNLETPTLANMLGSVGVTL
ncbi:hypothetical protein HDU88_000726 [Geranomyces variabilis]|nr:hypothetical protein HDU88_000726 [Geranomyces variabilis]